MTFQLKSSDEALIALSSNGHFMTESAVFFRPTTDRSIMERRTPKNHDPVLVG